MTHDEKKDWEFFRKTAREVFWPHIEQEYRDELNGIVDGLSARGVEAGHVGHRGHERLAGAALLRQVVTSKGKPASTGAAGPGDHCSAFVATGSYTKDGRVVIGHNNWTSYSSGERWNIIFDIVPAQGQPHPDGRHARADPQRRRFRRQLGRHHDHRDHHQRIQRIRSQRRSGIRARAQGHAVCRIHRRFRAHHEGRQQRRLRQQLAGGRPQDQRDRQPGAGPEERHAAAHHATASSWARISRPTPS